MSNKKAITKEREIEVLESKMKGLRVTIADLKTETRDIRKFMDDSYSEKIEQVLLQILLAMDETVMQSVDDILFSALSEFTPKTIIKVKLENNIKLLPDELGMLIAQLVE